MHIMSKRQNINSVIHANYEEEDRLACALFNSASNRVPALMPLSSSDKYKKKHEGC
jgi:hypothetical protein